MSNKPSPSLAAELKREQSHGEPGKQEENGEDGPHQLHKITSDVACSIAEAWQHLQRWDAVNAGGVAVP